ncbi:hypothetical protein FHG87_011185 [Trinorchestia longiramus]|nr:hypothetical protein FHG87_011185 [Trinorchestia longiramus]
MLTLIASYLIRQTLGRVGEGCKATHTRTVALTGPNGSECVSVVEECRCVGPCFRATRLQHIYNFTSPSGQWTGGSRKIQVIDIGACVGECSTGDNQTDCVYESRSGDCLMSLKHSNKTCTTAHHEQRFYHSSDGLLKTLNLVKDCACS